MSPIGFGSETMPSISVIAEYSVGATTEWVVVHTLATYCATVTCRSTFSTSSTISC
jgi:hypothetical protein